MELVRGIRGGVIGKFMNMFIHDSTDDSSAQGIRMHSDVEFYTETVAWAISSLQTKATRPTGTVFSSILTMQSCMSFISLSSMILLL